MTKDEFKAALRVLGEHGGYLYIPERHAHAFEMVKKEAKNFIPEVLEALNSEKALQKQTSLPIENYEPGVAKGIIEDILKIIGELKIKEAVPFMKEILSDLTKYDWGVIYINAAEALINLGEEKTAIIFLKNRIKDKNSHREMRIISARILIKYDFMNLFGKNEFVDCSGKSMTSSWSGELQKMIDQLRER